MADAVIKCGVYKWLLVVIALGMLLTVETVHGRSVPLQLSAIPADDDLRTMPWDSALVYLTRQFKTALAADSCSRASMVAQLRLSQLYWEYGRYDIAEPEYMNLAKRCRRCLSPADTLRIQALFGIGAMYADVGFYDIAKGDSYLREALRACDESPWCTDYRRALILRQTALAIGFRGDPAATELLQASLQLFEQLDNDDSTEVARSLWFLRKSFWESQRFDKASVILQRLLRLSETKPELAEPPRGLLLSAYGEELHSQGDDASAVQSLLKALPLLELNQQANSCRVARTCGLIAECLNDMGRFKEAEPYYVRAVTTYQSCGEVNPPYFFVSASTALGNAYLEHGRLTDAQRVLTAAYEIAKDSLGRHEDAHAYLLLALAQVFDLTDDLVKAESFYTHALAIAEQIHIPVDPRIATFLEPLAEFYEVTGRPLYALPMQARALRLRENSLGPEHPLVAESLHRISFMIRKRQGTAEFSAEEIDRAIWRQGHAWDIQLEHVKNAIALLPEEKLMQLSERLQEEAAHAYSMLVDEADDSETLPWVQRVVSASKARIWDTICEQQQILANEDDPTLIALNDSLRAIRTQLARAYVYGSSWSDWNANGQLLAQLVREKARLNDEISLRSQSYLKQNWRFDPQAFFISSVMPRNSVLVDFVRYEHDLSLRETETRYLALVVKSDSSATIVPLGSGEQIDNLVKRYHREFSDPHELDLAEFHTIARELCRVVWNPIADLCTTAETVFVGPDGLLNAISFETMLDSQNRYLAESYVFHYVTSGRELYRMMSEEYDSGDEGTGLLAMGDPDYDSFGYETDLPVLAGSTANTDSLRATMAVHSRAVQRGMSGTRWSSLPSRGGDATATATWWTTHTGEQALCLTGVQASEGNLKRHSQNRRVLYLSTHGYSLAAVAESAKNVAAVLPDDHAQIIAGNPLLTCGVVLAGANVIADTTKAVDWKEDGIVTAEEVAALDLHNTDLVVLAACETASGTVVNGEGVYSLRRAFELAGARTVISSLWSVNDGTAKDLMVATLAADSLTIPYALHRAMLQSLNELRRTGNSDHPYFWAGFISSGDPRTTFADGRERERSGDTGE